MKSPIVDSSSTRWKAGQMSNLALMLNHLCVETLGWSLIHFLWQGILIATLSVVVLVMLKTRRQLFDTSSTTWHSAKIKSSQDEHHPTTSGGQ